MRAVEFETELTGGTIQIPESFQTELALSKDKHVRVILLMDEFEKNEETEFKSMFKDQFLSGYDAADAIYDIL